MYIVEFQIFVRFLQLSPAIQGSCLLFLHIDHKNVYFVHITLSSINFCSVGAVNFEYGNFNTNLISKNRRLVCSKTSTGKIEFSNENGNFEKVVRN